MIDIRIATDPEKVEILSKILGDSSFMDIDVSISSIIPTINAQVVRRAARGADILLVASENMEELSDLSVGHVEHIKLPDGDDPSKIKKALRDGMIRAAMNCIGMLSRLSELEEEAESFRLKEGEYQEMRSEYAELKEKEIFLERVLEESENLKRTIHDLRKEMKIVRREKHDFNGIEVKDLLSFPLDELWKEISGSPSPRNDDIDVAIKRLNLEGSIMVSCGYIAAASREEALDMLRIVKITQELQKRQNY
jgi:predicted nuclease with TOPRIM domain